MEKKVPVSKQIMGALLVAGTTIGAGMLALPVAVGQAGFVPALFLNILSWLFMIGTALLLLEVCQHMQEGANLVSMATHFLKKKGKFFSWALYLLLFYSLTIAYIVGGGNFFMEISGEALSISAATILFVLLFAPIVYAGAHAVSIVNSFLMGGLLLSYAVFVILGVFHIDTSLLLRNEGVNGFLASLSAFPIIFISFSFQGVVPSLYSYLGRNVRVAKRAVLVGSILPLLLNLLWVMLVLGIVPLEGPFGLATAKVKEQSAVVPLIHFIDSPLLRLAAQGFAFFALTTSFLGVTLGLVDFFADGFKIKKTGSRKWQLFFIVFVPTTLISISNPKIFLLALTYAGGLGSSLLLGLMPILMVSVLRYSSIEKLPGKKELLFGGRPLLFLMSLFIAFEIFFAIKVLV